MPLPTEFLFEVLALMLDESLFFNAREGRFMFGLHFSVAEASFDLAAIAR